MDDAALIPTTAGFRPAELDRTRRACVAGILSYQSHLRSEVFREVLGPLRDTVHDPDLASFRKYVQPKVVSQGRQSHEDNHSAKRAQHAAATTSSVRHDPRGFCSDGGIAAHRRGPTTARILSSDARIRELGESSADYVVNPVIHTLYEMNSGVHSQDKSGAKNHPTDNDREQRDCNENRGDYKRGSG